MCIVRNMRAVARLELYGLLAWHDGFLHQYLLGDLMPSWAGCNAAFPNPIHRLLVPRSSLAYWLERESTSATEKHCEVIALRSLCAMLGMRASAVWYGNDAVLR